MGLSRNARTGVIFAAVASSMAGLGFASVPLYRIFCQSTGFNGTTQRADGDPYRALPAGKIVDVRFDANVNPSIPWRFAPERHVERVALGAREMAFFTATNLSTQPVTGTATFNVTPVQAGQYFTKIQCFCFTEQTLKPGETVRMPVIFYVDPKLATDADTAEISEITLSYTFFKAADSPNDAVAKAVDSQGRAG